MKKFVLVISTICIFALLIALNYLLWDNTNKDNEIRSLLVYKESSNLNFEALQNENLDLKNENESYKRTVTNNIVRMANYENTIKRLTDELASANVKTEERDIMVEFLKKIMNTKIFTDIINDWVTGINQKDYTKAYELQNLRDAFDTKQVISLDKFRSFFYNIDRMDLKSMEMNLNDIKRISNKEIAFTAIFDVTKTRTENNDANQSNTIMYDGMNRAVIVFKFNEVSESWFIYQMTFYKHNITDS